MFSCEFYEISQNTFFTEHLRTTASSVVGFLRVLFYLMVISFFLYYLRVRTYNRYLFSQKSSVVDVRLVSEYASDYETMHCRGIYIETATAGVL